MSDTKERRIELWPDKAELKETNYRDPATDEYEYDGSLWAGKHLICRFEESCEDAPRLFLDAHNTANECDMLPSEILAKLREAEERAQELSDILSKGVYQEGSITDQYMKRLLSTLNLPKP